MVFGQRQQGKIAAVALTPYRDTVGIDLGLLNQILAGPQTIVQIAYTPVQQVALFEMSSVTGGTTIVRTNHDVAFGGKILTHRIPT